MSNTKTVRLARPGAPSDRILNRLIGVLIAIIAVGLPLIGIVYYMDRHVEAGPSIAGRAVVAAEAAVRDNPNQLNLRVLLAQAYTADNRSADAIEQYAIVLEAQPANASALLGRANLYRAAGQYDPAAVDYQKLIDAAKDGEMAGIDKSLESAYYGLGAMLFAQNKPRDAATQLANALKIDGTDADALDLMGQSLIAVGDFQNAADALLDAVKLVPIGWCDPYAHLAQAYSGMPDPSGVAYANGMVALCENRVADAESALTPLIGGLHSRDALVGLGLAAEQRGDLAAASGFYQRVLAVVPDDFAAQNGLDRVGVPPTALPTGSPNP
jgi:tetratricopeptide (TPR) repeat protein